MKNHRSPWFLYNAWFDVIFFFMPFVIALCFAIWGSYFFPSIISAINTPLWFFFFTIIFDVGHVWGTLYRGYFHKENMKRHRSLLIIAPIFSFLLLLIAWWIGYFSGRELYVLPLYLLAWFAVFHFIKQQVGFIMLYSRKESHLEGWNTWKQRGDNAMMWIVTLTPMYYWWTHYESISFEWFEAGEFALIADILPTMPYIWIIYFFAIVFYTIFQLLLMLSWHRTNPLKYCYLLGTALVWYFGIVHFNSAIIFWFGNMLVHGMNYYGIIIGSTLKEREKYPTLLWKSFFRYINLLLPLSLILFALAEEYSWDQFLWQSRPDVFWEHFYNSIVSPIGISLIIAWLWSIQLTHYILDRYIWKKDFGKIL